MNITELSELLYGKEWLRAEWLGWTYFGVKWTIRVVFSLRIASRRADANVSLAWLAIVLAFPVVGAILYLLLAESPLGRRRSRAHRMLTDKLRPKIVEGWYASGMAMPVEGSEKALSGPFRHLAEFATRMGRLPPMRGNALELISDTEELLRRLATDIDEAKDHCHLLYYIWMRGGNAEVVAESLIRAVRRGVSCRVLLDDAGSAAFLRTETCRRMEDAGVEVINVLPVNPLRARLYRLDLRNHRKIAVIDAKVAYAGSQNLTDITYHYKRRRHIGPWLDASVRVQGPAVQALAFAFLSDWAHEEESVGGARAFRGWTGEGLGRYLNGVADTTPGESIVQVVPTGPRAGHDVPAMREVLLTAIYAAEREIIISTPYFVPDEATEAALMSAAGRGVQVTLIVPEASDSTVVAAAGRSHFARILEGGVKIASFKKGVLHAKTLTADGVLSMIGSANFDRRSFELNFEVTLFVYDAEFAGRLRDLQMSYLKDSEYISAKAWRERPAIRRVGENFARLLGPLL